MISSCEFHFGFWDVTAREDAALTASQNQPWASLDDINVEETEALPNVATLEPNFGWLLDGSKELFPDEPDKYTWGWWSAELCQEDGSFLNPPTLTASFSETHSSAGITLTFAATLPGRINIKWYDLQGALLDDKDFEPDRFMYFCDNQVEDYGKVVVSILSMSAGNRWLRCTHILFGVLEVIGPDRVKAAAVTEEMHPISLTLPISTLELDFYSADGRFSFLAPEGVYRFFQWKQQVKAYATINGELRPMGVYYLQGATGQEGKVAELSLVNRIGVLDTLDFDGGIYDAVAVPDFLDELLGTEGISFELDPSLAGESLSGYLPICTRRQALQHMAFAIGAVIDDTRGDAIRLYPVQTKVSHLIGPERKIVGHKVKLEELVTQVDVTAHSYQLSDEIKELAKVQLELGEQRITHSTPSAVTAVTGANLITDHPNYAIVEVSTAGEVILTGHEYVDTTTIHSVKAERLPTGTKSSAKPVTNATLVDPGRAPAVAQRVYDYYQQRYTDEGRVLPGSEAVGQVVELQSIGGRSITGAIQRLRIDLSGGYIAQMSMRGA